MSNRAQRRAMGLPKEPTYTLTRSQIQEIKKNAVDEALNKAFVLMLGLPVMVIHDHYSKLIKKEVDGKSREERFTELLLDLQDSVDREFISYQEIIDCLEEECGIQLTDIKKRGIYSD